MKRRRFLIIVAGSLVGIIGIGSIIKKLDSAKKSILGGTLNGKFADVGFSIRCGLSATEGRLVDKMGEEHITRMEFSQVLVDRFFLDESEFIRASNLLNRK